MLNPSPDQSTDANGIPDASAQAPQSPTRTRVKNDPCAKPAATQPQEWFSWRLTQAYFFDPTFGHAVITSRRNIFDTTLDLSGVAFLTEPRNISPLISRARLRTSGHTDIEWDFDYDTGAKKFTSSNLYVEARANNLFGGVSFASLNAPGRFATETIDTNNNDQQTLVTLSHLELQADARARRLRRPQPPGVCSRRQRRPRPEPRHASSTPRSRRATTGTAAAFRSSTASTSWARCATRTPTASTSRLRTSARPAISAARNESSSSRL